MEDMPNRLNSPANGFGAGDRRDHSRVPVSSLAYVELGGANGGIVVNLSKNGLALTTAMRLPTEGLPPMRIQLPKSRNWIEASGEIVWMSESRKRAGVRFVGLTEEVRSRIEAWRSLEASAFDAAGDAAGVPGPPREARGKPATLTSKTVLRPPPGGRGPERTPTEHTHLATDQTVVIPRSIRGAAPAVPPQPEILQSRPSPAENAGPTLEQRGYERQRVASLAYVDLGECNGGILLNVSEGGIHVRAAAPLVTEEAPALRFQLPPQREWITASGQIVWTDESRTAAGIEFVDLPEETAARIREWARSDAAGVNRQGEVGAIREQTERLLEALAPSTVAEDTVVPAAGVGSAVEQVSPVAPRAPLVPADVAEPVRVIVPVPVSTGAGRVPQLLLAGLPEPGPAMAPGGDVASRPRPSWIAFAVSVTLAALLSSAVVWFLAGRGAVNKVVAKVENMAPHRSEPAEGVEAPRDATSAAADAPAAGFATQTAPAQQQASGSADGGGIALPAATTAPQQTNRTEGPAGRAPISKAGASPGAETARQGGKAASALESAVAAPAARPSEVPPTPAVGGHGELAQGAQIGQVPAGNVANPPAGFSATALAGGAQASRGNAVPPATPAAPQTTEIVKGTVTVSASPFPSIRIPPEVKAQATKEGASLQIGQLTARVEPLYPEDAQQRRVEGTVKLHAVIGRDGAVQNIEVIGGPPLLVPAAVNAVRQWRYTQTLLGGQPVEAEQNITIVFRLTKLQTTPTSD
jgi:TonB family protein